MKKLLFILAVSSAFLALPLTLEYDHLEFLAWGLCGTLLFGILCAAWDEMGR